MFSGSGTTEILRSSYIVILRIFGNWCWSSSQNSSSNARNVNTNNGNVNNNDKANTNANNRVRAFVALGIK